MTRQILLFSVLLLSASPLAAQSRAKGRATITIGEIMSLQVRPNGGLAILDADGVHRELDDAVSLEVFSNREWQLLVVAEGDGHAEGPSAADAAVGDAVWLRVGESQAGADEYRRAEDFPVVVASGSRGRSVLAVDYRWVDGPGRELDPGAVLHFTLSPR